MSTRVMVTVEMTDPTSFSKRPNEINIGRNRQQAQTLSWTGDLFDDNPSYSAKELESALAAATTELVAKIIKLRGDVRREQEGR